MDQGIIEGASVDKDAAIVFVHTDSRNTFIPYVKKIDEKFSLEISFSGRLEKTEKPGGLIFKPDGYPELTIRPHFPKRTMAQNATLRGIERFIAWCFEGKKPDDLTVHYVHEAVVEKYSVDTFNPITKKHEPMRTSDPRMNTKIMSHIIEGALAELAEQDIPKEVMDAIGGDMLILWRRWYEWRYKQKEDPIEEPSSWEEYKKRHPVCEFCGIGPQPGDPLERAHIISGGRDQTVYEEPWNWLHVHHSHHMEQHGEGWGEVRAKYPHIVGKLDRAVAFWHEAKQQKMEV